MKKVVLASLLAFASAMPFTSMTLAQPQQSGGGIQMSQDEYKVYNDATSLPVTNATQALAKAAALEAYLKAYPNSSVKVDVLGQILYANSQANNQTGALDAADRLLAIDPNNLRALTFEVYVRRSQADQMADPSQASARAAALDVVAGYAKKGLAATKPKDMADADWKALTNAAYPAFYSAIADDQLANKNNADAITTLQKELHSVPVADTTDPQKQLQDTWVLAQAYYTEKPTPDYLNCAFYATRSLNYAPDAFKPTIRPVASYCYKKYHGATDGYDKFTAAAAASLDLNPADAPTPAPKPEDIVAQTIASTTDLAALAISDREFCLQYGAIKDPKNADGKTYADEVFDAVKGKSVELPDVLVVAATANQLQVAVSDDAVASKTADFTFNMKEPLKDADIPKAGDKVKLDGTYDSYTSNPVMLTMSDGVLVKPEPPKKKPATTVHHTAAHH